MKIIGNWGLWIVIALIAFLSYIAAFLIFAGGQRLDIVEEKYYEKGLDYQKQIDKVTRTEKLSEKVIIERVNETIVFSFPKDFNQKVLEGNIKFYRPSDSRLDREFALQLDSNLKQAINYSKMPKGVWVIKINWKSLDQNTNNEYYFEEEIVI